MLTLVWTDKMRWASDEYILYQGKKFQVEFYVDQHGELPAKKYFDAAEHQVKIKLLALVKYIAEEGKLFDDNKFRIVNKQERIYEFKPMAERFFTFFFEGEKIILTNAYRKRGQKVDKKELARAIRLKKDFELRVKEGDYYA